MHTLQNHSFSDARETSFPIKILDNPSNVSGNLFELFKREPSHPVFKKVFSPSEIDIINENDIEVKFCKEQIHIDDFDNDLKRSAKY